MAVRTAVVTDLYDGAKLITWTGLLNGDTGEAVSYPGHSDRSVQISGTFGVGGSVTIQGSNIAGGAGAYVALTDPQGNAITKTAAAIEMVTELTHYIQPSVTAGDGSTSLIVNLLIRRSQRP